jgi:hypothetical protein
MVPREARGADPEPLVGASSASDPTSRETIGARERIATIALDASPFASRASIARRDARRAREGSGRAIVRKP